ncbi:MAG: hypothetical protein FWC98_02525 [Bacteroidales bacterium]|nr:hypothetical protein [Bacteroidales bacterium]
MKRHFFILVCFLIAFSTGYSQMDRPLRAEIPVSEGFFPFALINLEEKGVLVHTATTGVTRRSQGGDLQNFFFFDVFLRNTWQIQTHFPIEYAVVNYALNEGVLQILLRNQVYRNTHTPTFLMHVNLQTGQYTTDTLFSLSRTPTAAGFVHNSRVWLVQHDRNDCAVNTAKIGDTLLHQYVFPRFSNQEIIHVALDTISEKLYLIHADNSRRDMFLTLAVFDTLANLVHSQQIRLDDQSRPVQAQLFIDTAGTVFIFGTYNLASERQRMDVNDQLTASAGFFSMKFDGSSTQLLSKQNFADFDDVDSRVSMEQSRTLRQRREGRRQPFSMDVLVNFQVRKINGDLTLIGESVTREYRTTTRTFHDYFGRVVPYSVTVFEGYSFNDTFIWILGPEGKPRKNFVSDISIMLNSRSLASKIALSMTPNETTILFTNATNILYKSLDPYEITHRTLRLQPFHRSDRVIEDHDSRIINWYDSNFLVVGYQTIQNNVLRGTNRRIVFYLAKLSLD